VRARLRGSGLNPSDTKGRPGLRLQVLAFPRSVPHSDGMGEIAAVGDGVARDRIGQRVWVWNAAWGRAFGTAAQSIVLPQQQAVALPDGVPDEVGACLGIPALTALHAMLVMGGVEGQDVLVAGGAGAVGHYAVQFAKLLGARRVLTTVSSPEKAALASAAGAHTVIDYRLENVAERVREATDGLGVHRVVEVDIAANAALDLDVIRAGGTCVSYGSGAAEFSLAFAPLIMKNIALQFFIVYNLAHEDRQRAEQLLTEFLAQGVLTHNIADRLPLDKIVQAHERVEQGRATGNVVLAIS
jgi:NADPH2:quinone reductase